MRSRALTFAWEFCWRLPTTTLPIAATFAAVALLVYGSSAFRIEEFAHESHQSLRQILHFSLFLTCLIGCQSVLLGNQRELSAYYTLPIPIWKLVGWKMLYAVAAAVLSYLALAMVLNVLFGAEWPLLGQSLFVAVCVMWGQALTWSLHRSQLVAVIARMTAVMLLGGWVISRYMTGPLLDQQLKSWDTVTTGEWTSLVAMAIAAYLYCLIGVSRDRYGSVPDFRSIGEAIEQFFNRLDADEQKFRSRNQALFWYQWRQKSFLIPAVISAVAIVTVAWSWLPWVDMNTTIKVCTGLSVLGMLYCAAIGMLVGNYNDDLKPHSFNTTRPATDTEMAHSVLKTMSWSIVLAWLIWCVSIALVASRFVLAGRFAELIQQIKIVALDGAAIWWIWGYIIGGLMVSWSAAGIVASLCLSRMSLVNSVAYAVFGAWLVWCTMVFTLLPHEWHRPFIDATFGTLGAGFIIGTLIANGVALRHRLIRWQAILAGAIASVVLLSVVYVLYNQVHYTLGMFIFALGICCLPAAPLATAPLAVSWNRHR